MHDRAYNRLVVRLSLTTLSGLHISAGDGGLDAGGRDVRCAHTLLDGWRGPFVPGSTLRGALRGEAMRVDAVSVARRSGLHAAVAPRA